MVCSLGRQYMAGLAHVMRLCGLVFGLQVARRAEEAMAIAEETLSAARAHANPD